MAPKAKTDRQKALDLRAQYRGVLGCRSKAPVRDKLGLSLVYTPGVAEPCKAIAADASQVYAFTSKGHSVALVSNGGAFLDMGAIGPAAMLPVLEGEAAILSELAGLNATPVCVWSAEIEDVAFIIRNVAPTFGVVAVLGMEKDAFEALKESVEIDVPLFRYEDVLEGVFARRSGMSEREKFASSYLVMPGFIRAILATRPERMMPLAFYAAAREIDESLKSFSLGETGAFDRTLAFKTARACADAFIASDEAHRKVNAELLALRMQQALYNGRRSLIPAAEKIWSAADISACSLDLYNRYSGSIRTRCRIPIVDKESISLVAAPASLIAAEEISAKPSSIRDLTGKTNSVAVVTDGSAILGLGNIGSTAGMPVMEGKCVLFKTFSGIDAFPLCLATQQPGEIVRLVSLIAGTYGGINLEDVAAPKCFEVERALSGHVDSCVFHDDQHGTETVVLAGLINALKLADRAKENCRVVMNGAGAAGLAVARMLLNYGFADIIICDTRGAIYDGRKDGMNDEKREMAKLTNKEGLKGGLADAMKGRDVFIGVSVGGCVTAGMVASMNKDPIIFALANPVPEIMPAEAKKAGARIIATGRSDFSNQVNNALIFPAVFRGALDAGAAEIGEEMKVAAAEALASCIPADELTASRFIPSVLELHVHGIIASAVAAAALRAGRNTREVDAEGVLRRTNALVYEGLEHCLAPSQKGAAEEPPAPPEGAETPAPQKKRGRKKAESPDKPEPDTAD